VALYSACAETKRLHEPRLDSAAGPLIRQRADTLLKRFGLVA
jgi:hypothetical protein